jgi:UDP-N-acetylglucosamine:LPS N-acetylglucosamine transferase
MLKKHHIDYKTMIDMIKLHKIDVLICDHWFEPCMYAANAAKIPFIVTSSHDITKGKINKV